MIKNLIRPNIVKMQPYVCARDLYQKGVFMDANENPYSYSPVKDFSPLKLNRYPDPYSTKLKNALSRYIGIGSANIFASSGSDEIIDLLMRLFVDSDEEVLIFEPTYGMYRVLANLNNLGVKSCFLDANFQVDFEKLQKMIGGKTKMIFLCSPNNPSGNLIKIDVINKIMAEFDGILVIDEAYIEFAETGSSRLSLANVAAKSEKLVVLRTLSKAWGLAGIRIGYCVAGKAIIEYLNKIKLPYNVNLLSAYTAIKALANPWLMREKVRKIIIEREYLRMKLVKFGFQVFESSANFLLVRISGASNIARRLAEDFGIIVRDLSSKTGLKNCFRVTVGTSSQNRNFIQALTLIL